MDYRTLGQSGLKVSPLCLGCMSYGEAGAGTHAWTLTEADSQPFFRQALEGLGKQTLDGGEVAALTRFTAPEEPLPVRRSALAALAAQKKAHPEVEGTLKALLVQTSDRESMEIIMRALYQQ